MIDRDELDAALARDAVGEAPARTDGSKAMTYAHAKYDS